MTYQVDILNPKANKLLKNLAELNLISIKETKTDGFLNTIKKLREKAKNSKITLEEITKEVELVRAKRYAKSKDRIIIDTNIWISFLITKNYSTIDSIFFKYNPKLLFSKELLEEFIDVSQRIKFKKYFTVIDLQELMLQITYKAEFIEVKSKLQLCRDKKDNFLLSLAKDGKATHLITGDKDLLDLKTVNNTKILTIKDYCA